MVNVLQSHKTAMFAGGCFWCVEADFEKLSGILKVESGYAGGTTESPTYENYAEGGHREVVEVTYDPTKTSYRSLVEHIIFYSDPTDAGGSFADRGAQYAPAIYFETEEEKRIAREVVREVEEKKIYDKPLAFLILPRVRFWRAEEFHQGYASKNPARYSAYRTGSGREAFIEVHRDKMHLLAGLEQNEFSSKSSRQVSDGASREKPPEKELREKLSPIQYEVTQKNGTERPFENEYCDNKAEGLYVDVVSGEPLFLSTDKYDSGTGWPSFVKPIDSNAVLFRDDISLPSVRTEVRSAKGDSHLGHVFDDGPSDRGGKRYCMNSAALHFVPKEQLMEKGYGEYLKLFDKTVV
ncbi:MAG: peptide-methionine (R)-S-oxide reductase MsrB [Candidatus Moraniibacteriota bacterium]|nr:MAG: peptide-methionine (R)-S-oxide reductase MsrB [Candidatus Moranbacteria bacterium]